MEYFMPSFRALVASGHNIIVAGHAFGCGSSREVAVNALLGAGVQCVIARSFSFIYARNQPNVGLLGITITDERFFDLAEEGSEVAVDVDESFVWCAGERFGFRLSDMEKALIAAGGLTQAFRKFGKGLFGVMCKPLKGFEAGRTGDMIDIEQVAGLI
jgi:3-isopropylmalate dehydratase small subunit